MTDKIKAAIEASRERDSRVLAGTLGNMEAITLKIYMEPRFREALDVAADALEYYVEASCDGGFGDDGNRAREAIASVERILSGDEGGGE